MGIAHLCLTCGTDLARIRPRREPHYGLSIITCPRCAGVSVRRVHPIWSWWKNFRRLDAALRVLATQLVMAVLLALFSTMLCVSTLIAVAGEIRGKPEDHLGWVLFWTFGVFPPITGAWLTAGFSHLRHGRVWLGWWAFMVLLLIVPVVISASVEEMPPGLEQWRDRNKSIFLEGLKLILLPGAVVQGLVMVAATTGIPIGKLLIWLTRRAQQMIWRMRRRSRRIGRAA